jgi:hypothetical protein
MLDTCHIREVKGYGSGNMAETLFLQDAAGNRIASALRYLRVHYASGSGTAALTIGIDDERGADWDVEMFTRAARGNGADLHFVNAHPAMWRIGELSAYTLTWTDPGMSTWSYVAGLEPVKTKP